LSALMTRAMLAELKLLVGPPIPDRLTDRAGLKVAQTNLILGVWTVPRDDWLMG
jgi:hypothetical protein